MRTIQTVKGVKRSRVHLVIPKKSTFIEDEKKPTASVFLDLDPGRRLEEKQIYGIGVLVASAVEGLNVEDVTIVDSRGNVLSKNSRDPLISMSATQLDFKRGLEKKYESQVEDMLSRVVGEGSAVVRVYADLDFSRVSETQTLYDADGSAVRSELKD